MDLKNRDQSSIWHPYTQHGLNAFQIPIVKASGAVLTDEDGHEIIDAISSWWVNIHGHGHPYINEKISKQFSQLDQVIFAGFTHPSAIELSERVLKQLPFGLSKVFFSDNGSTAVEIGLKMAFQFFSNTGQPRKKVIVLENAYHGDTIGTMSLSARGVFSHVFSQFLFEVITLPTDRKANEIEAFIDSLPLEECFAILYEPLLQGAAGMKMLDASLMNQVLQKCQSKGVLCIADEVFTGFGRTGKMWASEWLEVSPDIICLSKGLTAGVLPMGLTVCSENIYKAFLSQNQTKTFFHGHSFTGNGLSCAAALANLDLFEMENTWEKIKWIENSQRLFKELLSKRFNNPSFRSLGTVFAFELQGKTNDYLAEVKYEIFDYAIKRGVLLRPLGNTIYTLPPYCIEEKQMELINEVIVELIERYGNG